mgnify:CR=1 FL=1
MNQDRGLTELLKLKGANLYQLGYQLHGSVAAITQYLSTTWLWERVRVQGGAYGAFCPFDQHSGMFSLASYRDPHIAATLKVFEGAADFLCSGNFDETDIKEAILQVCSEIDKPDPPGPAARKAFYRRIIALSDELRERFKQRLIGLSRREVMTAAEQYFGGGLNQCSVAVIGSEEKLREANAKLPEPLALFKI